MKYAAPRIKDMQPKQIKTEAMALLIRIHVITGWTVPVDNVLNVLVDQFIKFLGERYPMLNTVEIEQAFRTHGIGVPDWGKQMNLTLIAQVLEPYLVERQRVSEIEASEKHPEKQRIFTQEEIDDERRADAQAQYSRFLQGHELMAPEMNKAILKKDGFLIGDDEKVVDFFKRCAAAGRARLYVKS